MCITNMFFLEGFALIQARAVHILAHIGPGPDMTEVRVLVQFGMFRVQKWYFDEFYR